MFEFVGDQPRAAPPDNGAFLKDGEEGRIWQLTLSQSAKGESAQLMHFQPDAEAHEPALIVQAPRLTRFFCAAALGVLTNVMTLAPDSCV
jgi:hypothetical protein